MWLLPAIALALGVTVSAASQPAVPAPSAVRELTRVEQAVFLERARIVERRRVSKGVTGTVRVTLTDGAYTHDASVQTINQYKAIFEGTKGTELGFQDTWRYNLAAYHLDGLLELEMIPVTVARKLDGQEASFTWWVDDVMMDEGERYKKKIIAPDLTRWNHQLWTLRIFDQLIQNSDRNLGNMLIDRGWKVWMIDHTRAFRRKLELTSRENLTKCDRQLLARLKALTRHGCGKPLGSGCATRRSSRCWPVEISSSSISKRPASRCCTTGPPGTPEGVPSYRGTEGTALAVPTEVR